MSASLMRILASHIKLVLFQNVTRSTLRGLQFVEVQQSAESFVPADATDTSGWIARGERDDVAQALMVALGMVVHDKLVDGVA